MYSKILKSVYLEILVGLQNPLDLPGPITLLVQADPEFLLYLLLLLVQEVLVLPRI